MKNGNGKSDAEKIKDDLDKKDNKPAINPLNTNKNVIPDTKQGNSGINNYIKSGNW
eukprot:CAMPEP_0176373584 /NCGR_PEP_ID=MMETSP0126-20121128/26138_1 /TAXON_ID=141414 ORGANISM="Strombidinopsis acuminatum, Strain SPMC142" /NCGR_SAMPLE_ID=MMETSP0126 /ASSEMBLY_ACC=CAM_ASM_000229 /LENGTH=55 /DNA_ID=CAMNT_0017733775 /DNA_START=2563 /DNA_END=2727 /DNA_ORIENTATION=-